MTNSARPYIFFAQTQSLCEECLDLVDRYEGDAAGRQRIAQAGMARAHENFGCQKLAGHIVDLVEKGRFEEDWAEFL